MRMHHSFKRNFSLLAMAAALACGVGARAADPVRTTLNFDADWRFFKGEPPAPAPAQPLSGNYAPIDPASFAMKDDAWQKVTLPHDWSIEGPFAENAPTNAAGAFLPSGVSWYRKTFTLPAEARGKRIFIEFDGVMSNSEVYINKGLLGSRPNGYVPLRYDMTDYINWSGPNLLAVRSDTSRQPSSRWYTGAGIYRHTRLVIQNPVHLENGATFISTPEVKGEQATVRVATAVINQSAAAQNVALDIAIMDGTQVVKRTTVPAAAVQPGATIPFSQDITIDRPILWDPANPHRYQAVVTATTGGAAADAETVNFGVRLLEWKPATGFWINGQNIKLLGVCLHHDAGGLGAAVPASVWEYRLSELKKYGVNAIRTAHNPPSTEFLDACDKLGLMVMDELFDVWTVAKEPGDYHLYFKDWWKRDLEDTFKRDRNHPSIVIWSLGNEIWDILPQNPDPAADQFIGPNRSIDIAKNIFGPMRDLAHQLDPGRPVTVAEMRANVAGAYTNGFADMMDVIGQNYRDSELAKAHSDKPSRIIIGTENYKTRDTWIALRDNPALAGQFLWAGIDYLGESGAWPNVVSPSGILDRTCWPRGEALERQAWWSTKPVVHAVRMQNTPTRPGRPSVNMGYPDWTPADASPHQENVNVYSNCDEVELFLNDKSLGAKPRDPADNPRAWQVPFAPGTLRAVAKNKGQIVGQDELRTAGPVAKVVLQAEKTTLPNDWDDVVYVRALLTDANGVLNPNARSTVKFSVSGPGTVVAVDSGDLADHASFQAGERAAWQGTCVAVIRATANSGKITVTADVQGASAGTITIDAAGPAR